MIAPVVAGAAAALEERFPVTLGLTLIAPVVVGAAETLEERFPG
jgi:hypothetical protein